MHVGTCIMPTCQCARSHATVIFASIAVEPMLLTLHEVTLPIDPAEKRTEPFLLLFGAMLPKP
ncbi:hypothetical protein B5E41_28105 [Rhizobium esperanzae]|uniref:Uncharacterized protein n=1 Tax=Rhizobium esperanzae TaxID=1967781 RepID=A0A246DLZ3_9HYPH|nr:hypothetical protein B5E41_28105 [Rhizobium esperanzae]